MQTPARLRLYQYAYSPFCIPIELILRNSGIAYEVVNLNVGDPAPVIQLTKGAYYQVPVIEDLFTRLIIYDKGPGGDDVAQYVASLSPLMKLFPEEVGGLQRIFVHYIENECENFAFKVCDAQRDQWLKSDLERGLHMRHKERKFGVGCLEQWTAQVEELTEGFHRAIWPFEQMLGQHPFLTGASPVYADYVLCGVIGTFLFPGNTSLPANYLMLEGWYTKMRAGNFRSDLDDMQIGSHEGSGEHMDPNAMANLLSDVADVEKVVAELKLRPGTNALDVATGHGHTALCLAAKGFNVTACDTSPEMLKETADLAARQNLTVALHEHPAEKLPYADGAFGLITCRVAAHYLTSPDEFIRESTRVLKTYGYIVIIDNTVPDDQVDAYEWMNAVEKLRDPNHVRFVTPNTWRKLCVASGLTVTRATQESLKQPDLNAYFNSANTPKENRRKVLEMVAKAPTSVRDLFRIGQEDGKIIWYWRRLTFIAGKL